MTDDRTTSLDAASGDTPEEPVGPAADLDAVAPEGPPDAAGPADLARERNEYYDRLLRTTAEFDNYRKRVERERHDLADVVAADVIRDMLPVLDDLERALQVPPPTEEAEAYRKGFEIIRKQWLELLRKRGVTPIETLGQDFDPRYHEAIAHEASDAHRDGEVIGEIRRGYMLRDRLLRPSMVRVAKA